MKTQDIAAELDETMTELLQLMSSLDEEHINVVPFQGSWTAGQLAQHLIRANGGFVRALNGPVQETGRAPDELVEQIRTDFLNFDTKVEASGFVIPPAIRYDKSTLLRELTDINSGLHEAVETLDLTQTCTAFKLPVYGYLTRLEALSFVVYHTQRHIHQLKRIVQKVVSLPGHPDEVQAAGSET